MTDQVEILIEYYNKIIAFTQHEKLLADIANHIPDKTYVQIDQTCRKLFKRGLLAKRKTYYTALCDSYPDSLIYLIRTPNTAAPMPKLMMDVLADKYVQTSRLRRSERKSPRVHIGGISMSGHGIGC